MDKEPLYECDPGWECECLIGDTLILTDKGQVKIKDIKIGDMVLTRQGYKKVYNKQITGMC